MYLLTVDSDTLDHTTTVGVFSSLDLALNAAHVFAATTLDEPMPDTDKWVEVQAGAWFLDDPSEAHEFTLVWCVLDQPIPFEVG